MCLLLFAVNEHPDYPLVLAANRDEFYDRPTVAAQFWDDAPQVLGGRDLECGGTWLGMALDGRWAAVTSFRESPGDPFKTSRGHLVSDFLTGDHQAVAYAESVHPRGSEYAGFNFLAGDTRQAVYCNNRERSLREIQRGTHGLSNHLLDTPWPKLIGARERFTRAVMGLQDTGPEPLFDALMSREIPQDEHLPDTGIGLEWERLLSSAFIASAEYGTRSTTVMMVDTRGRADFIERTYLADDGGSRRPDHYREIKHRVWIELS